MMIVYNMRNACWERTRCHGLNCTGFRSAVFRESENLENRFVYLFLPFRQSVVLLEKLFAFKKKFFFYLKPRQLKLEAGNNTKALLEHARLYCFTS